MRFWYTNRLTLPRVCQFGAVVTDSARVVDLPKHIVLKKANKGSTTRLARDVRYIRHMTDNINKPAEVESLANCQTGRKQRNLHRKRRQFYNLQTYDEVYREFYQITKYYDVPAPEKPLNKF